MWNRFSPDEQNAIKAAAVEAGKEMTASGRNESEESIRVMVDSWNLKSQEMNDDLKSKWQAVSTEAYGHIRDNTVPGEIWDRVTQILTTYRAGAN